MIWKTAKTITRNLITDSWDETWVESLTGDDQAILLSLENIKSDLWQEGYVSLDTAPLTVNDLANIRLAAIDRMKWLAVAFQED